MQSEIFQVFNCYNFHDYGLQLMKTPNSKLELAVSHNHPKYNKGLKYLTLHVMSLYNLLVSPFKLNY